MQVFLVAIRRRAPSPQPSPLEIFLHECDVVWAVPSADWIMLKEGGAHVASCGGHVGCIAAVKARVLSAIWPEDRTSVPMNEHYSQ